MAISELTEITNETAHTYFMYVWDNKNEGRYQPYSTPDAKWEYPDEGKWLKIGPGAHLRADDCGIPDGGKSAGRERCRVIFVEEKGKTPAMKGDPERGLRITRTADRDGMDEIQFRQNKNGKLESSIPIPSEMHQTLLLLIDDKGIHFEQKDKYIGKDEQIQKGFLAFAEGMKLAAELFLKVAELIA